MTFAASIRDELDEDGAYRIGRAYAEEFEPAEVAVGRDMRVSSPTMAGAAIEGVLDAGVDVVDVGMIGTEMLYFGVGELDLDGGFTITASHNPKEYTGMKIVRRGALPVGGDSGLLEIRRRAEKGFGDAPARRGRRREHDLYPAFTDRVLSFIDPGRGQAAPGRHRRGERHGRGDAAWDPRAPPDRGGQMLLRARRHLSESRAQPAPAGEPGVRHPEGARRAGRPRHCLRRRRGQVLLRRRHRRVRAGRLRDRSPRPLHAREGAGWDDHLRRSSELGCPGSGSRRRRHTRS